MPSCIRANGAPAEEIEMGKLERDPKTGVYRPK